MVEMNSPQAGDYELIMGLDVSTKCIGVCLYEFNRNGMDKIVNLTHVEPRTEKEVEGIEQLFLKKQIFEEKFIVMCKDKGITKVVIEEPLLSSNNAMTVSVLCKFNGMISESIYRHLGIVPDYISSYDARKYAFPELMGLRKFHKNGDRLTREELNKDVSKNHAVLFGDYSFDCDKKFILWNKVSDMFPFINWIYDKKGELKKENFDASDALVTCLGYTNFLRNGEPEIEIKNFKKASRRSYVYDLVIWGKTIPKKLSY